MNKSILNNSKCKNMWTILRKSFVSQSMIFHFACSYLVLAFLTFTFIFARSPYLTYVSYIIFFWGALIIFFSLFLIKKESFNKIRIVLLLFVLSFLISSVFMYRYGIVDNVKGLIWLSLEIIVLFSLNRNSINSNYICRFLKFFIGISTFYALISLLMALFGYVHLPTEDNGDIVRGGMLYGRLFGMYADPNYGSVTSCLTIYSCIFLAVKKFREGKIRIIVPILLIIIQIFYFSLSGSRTGIVALLMSSIFVSFYFLYIYVYKGKMKNSKFICALKSFVCSVLVAVIVFSVSVGFEFMYESFEPKFAASIGGTICDPSDLFLGNFANSVKDACGIAVDKQDFDESTTHVGLLGRNESKDVSNQRLSLWKSSIEIFAKTPIIGASNRNFLEYARDVLPDSYVVSINYKSMHNVFFDVLVSQGILGLALWLVFLVLLIKNIYICYRRNTNSDNILLVLICGMFVVLLASSLFYSEIIYVNTIGSVFFWYVFGIFSNVNSTELIDR